jgi:hypothetical protein
MKGVGEKGGVEGRMEMAVLSVLGFEGVRKVCFLFFFFFFETAFSLLMC